MDRHENPYTPGAGAKPPALVGREADLDEVALALTRASRGQHARPFIFDGLRGVGKTVLINEMEIQAIETGWITSGVIECNENDKLAPLVARMALHTLRRLSRGKRVTGGLKRAFGVLKAFSWTIDEKGQHFRIDVDAITGTADSGDLAVDIVELMAEIGKIAAAQGSGALFLLDEMQFLGKEDLGLMSQAMHRVSQESMPVLLVGAGLPQLPLMLKDAKGYTERLFEYRTIGSLSRAASASALTIPAGRHGVTFSPEALDLILDASAGYPYFLQQWGQMVWDEAENNPILPEDVRAAEDLVDDALDRRFFHDRYERASDAEKMYMSAMADLGDDPRPSAAIAERLGMTTQQLSVRRKDLINKGLIYNPNEGRHDLDFTVPGFAGYVRRVHPFDPNQRLRRGRPPRRR